MEIVLGIEKKMSDEGCKSNISRIAGSGAGSMALAKHAASVTILAPADAKRWLFLTGGKRMRAWSSRLKKHLHIALGAVRANM